MFGRDTAAGSDPSAAAKAMLQAAPHDLAGLRDEALIAAVERLDRAYEQFPELEIEVSRSALATALCEAAEAADDNAALPLLMAGAVLAPAASPVAVAGLLRRMVHAGRGDAIAEVVAILAQWRSPGSEEIASALDELCRRQQSSAALAVVSGMLVRAGADPDRAEIELAATLRAVLPAESGADPAALAKTVLSARGRLHATARPHAAPYRETPLLGLAERVAAKLPPLPVSLRRASAPLPPDHQAAARLAVAVPEIGGAAVDWLPAMQVGPVGERREDAIAAHRGYSGHLAYGPYATLGPGDYCVRIGWRAGAPTRAASPDQPVLTIEAVSRHGKSYLAQRTLCIADDDRAAQELLFCVIGRPAEAVEVRVWTSGIVPLTIFSVAVERVGAQPVASDG